MNTNARVDAATWQRIENLFFQALALPDPQRRAFCARVAVDDRGIGDQLTTLLGAHAAEASVLDRSPLAAAHAEAGPEELAEGTRIGVWRLGALIGRGGAGEVYLAMRADGTFDQVVALKRLHRDATADLERFHAERQILAGLEDPGIARLLDGGVATDGRPYAVVEYVDGKPLTEHCRQAGADLATRLALFLQVCHAVAYAHRNLVVHRDLKPGNILVTPDGRIKLLDFGVAKRLDRNAATAADVTSTPFTSDYAAPEQLTGRPITTATDVYALGVILFELLSGERPWRSDGLPIARVVQLIVHDEPPPMSRAAAASAAPPVPAARLAGDLDAIVATCLRKEAADRYPTVDALVLDLERHRERKPVAARGRARTYIVGRLISRYRWAFAGGTLLFASLAAGLAATTWQARRAELERDVARRAATREEAVRNQITTLFRNSIAQKDGGPVTAKAMLDRSAQRLLKEYRGDPQLTGKVVITLADLYGQLEDMEGQLPLLEGYLAAAGTDGDPESVALAQQKLAAIEIMRGHAPRAAELLPKAEAVWASAPDRFREQHLESMFIRGLLQRNQGDLDGSIRTYRAALDERIAFSGRLHRETANLYNSLAISLTGVNRLDEALDAFRTTLDIYRGLGLGEDLESLVILGNTGTLAYRTGRLHEAETTLRTAFTKQREHAGDSAAVAAAMGLHGATLTALGRAPEAVDELRTAIDMATRFTSAASPLTIQNRQFLADALTAERDLPQARREAGQVLALTRERFGETGLLTLRTRIIEARIDLAEGRAAQSEQALLPVIEQLRKLGRTAEPWVATALVAQADASMALGRRTAAIAALHESLALRERLLSSQSWELALTRARLGEALKAAKDPAADDLLRQGEGVLATQLGDDHPDVLRTRRALAWPA